MTIESNTSRREFIGAISAGVAAAGSLAAATDASAQAAAPLKIVDFHNHTISPSWTLTNLANAPPAARAAVEALNRNLQSQDALLASINSAGIAARVINTPTAFIEDADGKLPPGTIPRVNDQMAELVAKHTGKLYGLATVDAFSGDDGAREVTRAVKDLKLRGLFLESAKRDLLLGDKVTRPTLATAASLGVPVFVHPLTDPELHKRFSRTGRMGLRLARGTINNAALISMLEGGTFDEVPKLQVVMTTLAMGGILLAGGFGDGSGIRSDAPALTRRHVYVDTMGIHPAVMRCAVDLLGADHVLLGTDWPIVAEKSVPERLQKAFAHCGLTAAEQQMIASGNTLKLLGVA